MIVNPNLRRQFERIDFTQVPRQTLTSQAARDLLDRVEGDWNKFEAYDQNQLDRDPKAGRLDVYIAPARYQAEVSKSSLYVSESLFAHGDPNGIPVMLTQRESEQNDRGIVGHEAIERPTGVSLRRYEIGPQGATLQEWFLASSQT
jgi:hypothetical protein